jgi:outer membrane protein assembly factor BamE (lipoprotein component of BamABCDE complex)
MPRVEPPPRPAYERLRRVKRGMTADQVAQLAGEPLFVDISSEGGETWYYGAGSSITFNPRGRVESFVGFQRP